MGKYDKDNEWNLERDGIFITLFKGATIIGSCAAIIVVAWAFTVVMFATN